MFKNYMITAIRNLWRNKTYSFINIAGFAFGISICLGISAYLVHEYSFDRYHTNSGRIYRLIDAQYNSSSIDYRVKDIIKTNYPEVENACLFQLLPLSIAVTIDNKGHYIENLASVDNAFFEMFTVPFMQKNAEEPFPNLNSVVITESAARQLFGDKDPLGEEIVLRNQFPVTVTGVIRDFPDNSSIQASMIVNAENDDFKFSLWIENSTDLSTYRWPFRIYLLLNENANTASLVEKINGRPNLLRPYEEKIDLLSLVDIYLRDRTVGSMTERGNPDLLILLMSIGLAILILAVINYVNLTSAQQNKRYKEIGVKRAVGAGTGDIFRQFLIESILVTFAAFLIAVVILSYSIPIYRSIFFDGLNTNQLLEFWYVIIPVVIVLGMISGLGSAFAFASISPTQALKGENAAGRHRFSWRNGLTVFQFTVSVVLIVCVIAMQRQIRYVKYNDPGFDEELLLKVDAPQIQAADRNAAYLLLDRLRQYPGITSVSITNGVPGYINTYMGANIPGKDKSLPIMYADTSFLQTFGIEVTQGRYPLPGDYGTTCLINDAAYEYFEWTDLENRRYNNGRPGGFEVIGVVNDFHYSSLRSLIEPMAILLYDDGYPTHISVKIAASQIGTTLQFIQEAWQELLPEYILKYEFYDSWLDAMYQEDEKLGTAIGIFAALAIVISCLGVLCMVIFSTQKRTKEIGIRKVVGASVAQLVALLSKEFLVLVATANIIAWPIAWFAMRRWLENFAYRIDLGLGVFILAGLLALVIALVTVSWQTFRAATANPVEALRYE
ncbi:MAG: ABC transporter permease [Fidelibacterota bacterium]|nr:MAG: ABC transporter permease [Candidatus Neomarinimicrobiota bacterium]